MKSKNRSLAGAAIAIFALPVFIGLTACLPVFPVPVGNPEKSSIDPEISGIWLYVDVDTVGFYVFEPYDKRSWLLTSLEISEDQATCPDASAVIPEQPDEDQPDEDQPAADVASYGVTMAHIAALGTECFDVERGSILKAWRTRLGGEWFMTWEDKGVFDAERGFEPEAWAVFHIDKSVPGRLRLAWFNMEHDGWDQLDDKDEEDITRQMVEKIIRKHAGDADFYVADDTENLILYRVQTEHAELVAEFFDDGVLD